MYLLVFFIIGLIEIIIWLGLVIFYYWAAKAQIEKKKKVRYSLYDYFIGLDVWFWRTKNPDDIEDPELKQEELSKIKRKAERYIWSNFLPAFAIIIFGLLATVFLAVELGLIIFIGSPMLMISPFLVNLYLFLSAQIENEDSEPPRIKQLLWYKW